MLTKRITKLSGHQREDGFFDTSLDEKRASIANCWRYQPRTDIIANDVLTKKQESLVKQRDARGPLSQKAVAQRIARMTKYFNKQEKYKSTDGLSASFFEEKIEVLSESDVPALLAKYKEYDENFRTLWPRREQSSWLTKTSGLSKIFLFQVGSSTSKEGCTDGKKFRSEACHNGGIARKIGIEELRYSGLGKCRCDHTRMCLT